MLISSSYLNSQLSMENPDDKYPKNGCTTQRFDGYILEQILPMNIPWHFHFSEPNNRWLVVQ